MYAKMYPKESIYILNYDGPKIEPCGTPQVNKHQKMTFFLKQQTNKDNFKFRAEYRGHQHTFEDD